MTDQTYTHELLREDEWTADGRMLTRDSVSWWEQIPILYRDPEIKDDLGTIIGALGNIRREGRRIYGDTDVEIPEDSELTCEVDQTAIQSDDNGRLLITDCRLIGANVSVKGTYPWKDNEEEEGGEADASRRDQQVVDPDDPRRVEDR